MIIWVAYQSSNAIGFSRQAGKKLRSKKSTFWEKKYPYFLKVVHRIICMSYSYSLMLGLGTLSVSLLLHGARFTCHSLYSILTYIQYVRICPVTYLDTFYDLN